MKGRLESGFEWFRGEQERFQKISEAYETLGNAALREKYDRANGFQGNWANEAGIAFSNEERYEAFLQMKGTAFGNRFSEENQKEQEEKERNQENEGE